MRRNVAWRYWNGQPRSQGFSLSPEDKVKIAARGPLWLVLQSPSVKGVSLRSNLSIWGGREKPPWRTSRVRPSLARSLAVRPSLAINGELASNSIGTSLQHHWNFVVFVPRNLPSFACSILSITVLSFRPRGLSIKKHITFDSKNIKKCQKHISTPVVSNSINLNNFFLVLLIKYN